MRNKSKLDALILSLEEISENCLDNTDNDEFQDQSISDANIALEGYIELHNTVEKLQEAGLEVTEDIASSLFQIASPKINKDPVMHVTFESIGDKAKDFSNWIVEKIKALVKWIKEKFAKFKESAKKLFSKLTDIEWKKDIAKVKDSDIKTFEIEVSTLINLCQPSTKFIDGAELKSSDVKEFKVDAFSNALQSLEGLEQALSTVIKGIEMKMEFQRENADAKNKLIKSTIDSNLLEHLQQIAKIIYSGNEQGTFEGKKVVFSDYMPAFFIKDEIENILNAKDRNEIYATDLDKSINGNFYFGLSNRNAYRRICEEMLGEYSSFKVKVEEDVILKFLDLGYGVSETLRKDFDKLCNTADMMSIKLDSFSNEILKSELDKELFEPMRDSFKEMLQIRYYHEAFCKAFFSNAHSISHALTEVHDLIWVPVKEED